MEEWLRQLRLEMYAEVFRQRGFGDLASLAALSSDDLDAMHITLQGHRTRILKHLPTLQQQATGSELESAPAVSQCPALEKLWRMSR
jgi:hypothetical protein